MDNFEIFLKEFFLKRFREYRIQLKKTLKKFGETKKNKPPYQKA